MGSSIFDPNKKTQVFPLANGGCGQNGRNYTLCNNSVCPPSFTINLYDSSGNSISSIDISTCTDSSKAIVNTLTWDWRIPALSNESPLNKIPKPYLYGGPIDMPSNEASGIIYDLSKYNYRTLLNNSPPQFGNQIPAGDLSGRADIFYNSSGKQWKNYSRNDVSGCTWWGRGTIQTTGKENYSVLNYLINDIYNINLCDDKSILCNGYKYNMNDPGEPKWMAGIIYWLFSVQPRPLTTYRDSYDKQPDGSKKDTTAAALWKTKKMGTIQLNDKTLDEWCDAGSTFKDMLDEITIYINNLDKKKLQIDNMDLMAIIYFISSFATFCVNGFDADTSPSPTGAVQSRYNTTVKMLLALNILYPISWAANIKFNDAKTTPPFTCTDLVQLQQKYLKLEISIQII